MEFLRAIPLDLKLSVEGQRGDRWSYGFFREYLLALARGEKFLLPKVQYPKRIELNQSWHELLNQMWRETRDGLERFALIGFKDDRRAIFLPTRVASGTADGVPWNVVRAENEKAIAKFKIAYCLGDIHSHPAEKIWPGAAFSAYDFYRILEPDIYLPMIGLVEGGKNVFAFRSRESDYIDPSIFSPESFRDFWRDRVRGWKMNLEIAKKYSLVLYRGGVDRELVKVNF